MPKTRKGELMAQHLKEISADIFWKNSYHGVTVDQIVGRAQVNKATFYLYFKSKEEAMLTAVDYLFESTKAFAFEEPFATFDAPAERLEAIFNRIYKIHDKEKRASGCVPGCPFMNIGTELATENELVRTKVAKIFSHFQSYHQKIVSEANDLGLVSSDWSNQKAGKQLQNILNGSMTSAKMNNRPKDILDGLETAKRVIGLSN